MRTYGGMIGGDLTVEESGEITAMVQGNVTIASGCDVVVSGMVNGDVVLRPGATAQVTGLINGTLRDEGRAKVE
ncbi:hypothetical protein V8J82_16815 [Gymnodinialimonas sp. 2305UL16-5]|uniref:hypothetical protein n=1 Tax=Gymnodinialimonas mytili TaxID=3126503 RepID=UPI00309887B6